MPIFASWQDNIVILGAIALICLVILVWLISFLWRLFSQNEKLKYEFITIIAHKYRTPLTQIKWLCENLLKEEVDPYKKESLANIRQSNDKLIGLTNSLIEATDNDRSALTSYNFEKASICDLVRNVSSQFKKSFHEKNIYFSDELPQENIFCKIDSQRIEFVLGALLENACTLTSPGKKVRVVLEKHFRKVTISVLDDGIGISRQELPKIFTKFYRSEAARRIDTEGFGMSLYLAKAIMRRHGGAIKVASAGLGTGSRFDLILKATKR
jgi:signal transduction histidine kinase